MRKYEAMLILPAEADDSVVASATERIAQVLKDGGGGEILSVDKWGRRRLAYEIANQSEGFYVVVEFNGDPTVITELDRVLTLADDVIRFKVVVRETEASPSSTAPASTPA
jgi:small subunit ribosomal protein S6